MTLQIKVPHRARTRCRRVHALMPTTHVADFVRKEYALAIKLKKNVVPVAHEEFDWPDRSRLPKDVEGIMGLYAVLCVEVVCVVLQAA